MSEDRPYAHQMMGVYQPLLGWISRQQQQQHAAQVEGMIELAIEREFEARLAIAELPTPEPVTTPESFLMPILMSPVLRSAFFHDPDLLLALMGREPRASAGARRAVPSPDLAPHRRAAEEAVLGRVFGSPGFRPIFDMRPGLVGYTPGPDDPPDPPRGVLPVKPMFSPEGARLIDIAEILWKDINKPSQTAPDEERLELSPVGLLDVFQQYFYDRETFLSPPVDHIWVAPFSTMESIQRSSRTVVTFQELETETQLEESEETSSTEVDELAEKSARESQRDISLAVSASASFSAIGIVSGSASSDFGYNSSVKRAKEVARRTSRETTTKTARKMKTRRRALTRREVTTEAVSTRRHSMSNPSAETLSFELRRKIQKVGVTLQHVGTRLCWQVPITDPGAMLGLSELVHHATSDASLSALAPPDLPPTPTAKTTEYDAVIPFRSLEDKDKNFNANSKATYDSWKDDPTKATPDLKAPSDSKDVIQGQFEFVADAPAPGYELQDLILGEYTQTDPERGRPQRWALEYEILQPSTDSGGQPVNGKFRLRIAQANFNKQPAVRQAVTLIWHPTAELMEKARTSQEQAITGAQEGNRQKAVEELSLALQERVKLSNAVQPRSPDDLRSEERSAILRQVVNLLADGEAIDRLPVVREQLRAMFDLDRTMYFLAPDWWRPRDAAQSSRITEPASTQPASSSTSSSVPLEFGLPESNFVVSGGQRAKRDSNYLITHDSEPARMGSSLGWVLQLDGDVRRNAFLNAPWATVVIPIRPGREVKTLEWLSKNAIEGTDSLDAKYVGPDGPTNLTIRQKLEELAQTIEKVSSDAVQYAATTKVFDTGFDAVSGFVAPEVADRVDSSDEPDEVTGLKDQAFEVFDQWEEIVPTAQIVPVAYSPPGFQNPAGGTPTQPPPDDSDPGDDS